MTKQRAVSNDKGGKWSSIQRHQAGPWQTEVDVYLVCVSLM